VWSVPVTGAGAISSLVLNGLAGHDALTVDSSAGDPFPIDGIQFQGSGLLSIASGTTLALPIDGKTPGEPGGYDQLTASGNIDLTGVNLTLWGGYAPTIGDKFTIINNRLSGGMTTATFNGLPEGTTFVAGTGNQAAAYVISYHGGDGNDVVLTVVNAAPAFVKGPDETATDESPAKSIAAWAKSISRGPPDEAGQKLQFVISTEIMSSTNNKPLFAAGPAIDPDTGNLTFTPVPNVVGTARVTVELMDDGGTAAGGLDTSDEQTFTIQITKARVWHNVVKPEDVNGDNEVAPNDLTVLISFLNSYGATDVPNDGRGGGPYCDVDADGVVAPKDLSRVIGYLNAFGAGEGERTEISNIQAPPVASDSSATDALFAPSR